MQYSFIIIFINLNKNSIFCNNLYKFLISIQHKRKTHFSFLLDHHTFSRREETTTTTNSLNGSTKTTTTTTIMKNN